MIVSGVICNKCGCGIYSRSRHDFHWCSCNSVAVDGGRDYLKVLGSDYLITKFDLGEDITDKVLCNDWNKSIDMYGLISPGELYLYSVP